MRRATVEAAFEYLKHDQEVAILGVVVSKVLRSEEEVLWVVRPHVSSGLRKHRFFWREEICGRAPADVARIPVLGCAYAVADTEGQ